MTLFIIDVSNNNGPDIDMAEVAREGFAGVFCKVSEGDYFTDSTWPAYRDAAKANGLLVAGYHYVRGDCDINAQADLFCQHLGDAPAMFDFEANSGDMSTFWALANAINARGVTLRLSYIPHWYAEQIGSPDLSQVPGLIQSSYVGGSGYASDLYPGDDSGFWAGFGGRNPDILQFTDSAQVAGHTVDANAFRGTRDQLTQLLGLTPATSTTSQGALMALTDAQQADLFQRVTDVWAQLLGPQGHGWPQLGTNTKGETLTPVDDLAALTAELAKVSDQVTKLATAVAALTAGQTLTIPTAKGA